MASQPATSEPATEGDVDDNDEDEADGGANNAAALARLIPILGSLSEGYSGADIKMLCRDAAMAPMRRAIAGKSPDDIRRMKDSGEVCALPDLVPWLLAHCATVVNGLHFYLPTRFQ